VSIIEVEDQRALAWLDRVLAGEPQALAESPQRVYRSRFDIEDGRVLWMLIEVEYRCWVKRFE
jgi:hypothetical protein